MAAGLDDALCAYPSISDGHMFVTLIFTPYAFSIDEFTKTLHDFQSKHGAPTSFKYMQIEIAYNKERFVPIIYCSSEGLLLKRVQYVDDAFKIIWSKTTVGISLEFRKTLYVILDKINKSIFKVKARVVAAATK